MGLRYTQQMQQEKTPTLFCVGCTFFQCICFSVVSAMQKHAHPVLFVTHLVKAK